VKTPRQILVADHLWDAFERMAREMGSSRDALVNQAMHMFARLNGFVVPDAAERAGVPPLPPPRLPDDPPRSAVAEQVLEAAERLERAIGEPTPVEAAHPAGGAAATLAVVREDGTTIEVAKDRFVIGRGKHCDLVLDSSKVSREHAAILHTPEGWFMEDLGSSNGTWHHRERVSRKLIADGDEFFICSERVRCLLR
jgi:FHA domain-containing protein